MQPDIGERMKECDCCKTWFHQHCENFERISNTNINLSQWCCSSCDQIPFVHINSLPYLVLDKLFMELCITDEKVHLTLALVCKKWKSFNNEKFIDRVHLQWLDQEYHANTWSLQNKEKYRQPFLIEQCFHCQRRYKVKIGYYRTSSGCTGVQLDLNAGSIYCSLCEPIHDRRWDTDF